MMDIKEILAEFQDVINKIEKKLSNIDPTDYFKNVGFTLLKNISNSHSIAPFFEVVADSSNNPQNKLNIGERNVWVWFTFPTPAGSIEIGVGILLRS